MPALPPSQIVPWWEKIGYGVGDAAATWLVLAIASFQTTIDTAAFGLTAAAAGTVLLVVRLGGAGFDPIMGMIADRTLRRSGRYRPWLLWSALPLGLIGVLAFLPSTFGLTGSFGFALATSSLLALAYSAIHLPYSALGGIMTSDQDQRTGLSAIRFVFVLLAAGAFQILALPLANALGQGDSVRGRQLTLALISLLCTAAFLVTFFVTRERVHPQDHHPNPLRRDLGDLRGNLPWILLCLIILLLSVTWSLRGAAARSYFTYCLRRPELFGAYTLCGLGGALVGIAVSTPFVVRFGKRSTLMICLLLTVVFAGSLLLLPDSVIGAAFVLQSLAGLAAGPMLPLLWSMMADVADYNEWKNSRRATGLIFSGSAFAVKVGFVLGGALEGWLLSWYSDAGQADPSAPALLGIRLCASAFPVVTLLLAAACLVFYPISKQVSRDLDDELAGRRSPSGLVVP